MAIGKIIIINADIIIILTRKLNEHQKHMLLPTVNVVTIDTLSHSKNMHISMQYLHTLIEYDIKFTSWFEFTQLERPNV